jgi:D-aminopeptidase
VIDALFAAVTEATEESVLNALFVADTVIGSGGYVRYGLPTDRVLELIRAHPP